MIGILLSGADEEALDNMAAAIREALFAKGLNGEVHYNHLATKAEWDKRTRLRSLLGQIGVPPPRLGKGCACTQWETCPACWARLAGRDAREAYELAEFKKMVEAGKVVGL